MGDTLSFVDVSKFYVLIYLLNCLTNFSLQEYLKTDPSGRDPDTPIMKISQGFEPPSFTGFFGVWDRDLWSVNVAPLISFLFMLPQSFSHSAFVFFILANLMDEKKC